MTGRVDEIELREPLVDLSLLLEYLGLELLRVHGVLLLEVAGHRGHLLARIVKVRQRLRRVVERVHDCVEIIGVRRFVVARELTLPRGCAHQRRLGAHRQRGGRVRMAQHGGHVALLAEAQLHHAECLDDQRRLLDRKLGHHRREQLYQQALTGLARRHRKRTDDAGLLAAIITSSVHSCCDIARW